MTNSVLLNARTWVCWCACSAVALWCGQCPAEWLTRLDTTNGIGLIQLGQEPSVAFLEFGAHSYAPDEFRDANGKLIPQQSLRVDHSGLAPFQGLAVRKVSFPAAYANQQITVEKQLQRDEFWDQIITVEEQEIPLPQYKVVEAGQFGDVLAPSARRLSLSPAAIESQRQSLVDPHLPPVAERELPFARIAESAYPLDFQKVLIASPHDPSPAFAFQNGQWLTTWLSRDLPKWTKEDHWFVPAVVIDDELVVPAPLSARTRFVTGANNQTLPIWTLEWKSNGLIVQQTIFSHAVDGGAPQAYVELRMIDPPAGARLALGVGRRPNVHYWDDKKHERTPIPFFTLPAGYRCVGQHLVDRWERVVLESAHGFELRELGPTEMLLVFEPNQANTVNLRTPQQETAENSELSARAYAHALEACKRSWSELLAQGAQAILPSHEWTQRIDIWKTQLAAITRVYYQGQDRLSYGAYFYQAYFGPEEGWSTVALAQWGRGTEARHQADIMLAAENRSKDNVHHQSRNGAFAWYAAEVARLTNDRVWLDSIAPALIENAEWTIAACRSTRASEPAITRGLLPPHIYGGDIRDPATSLYATAVCWKGLTETGAVLRDLASDEHAQRAERFLQAAASLKKRLAEVIEAVAVRDTTPPFLPLALALPSRGGKNEGPYERLTASRLGNYWNLFAPSVMELGMVSDSDSRVPNSWLLEYMQTHGGLWAGLPRFHEGLDAAYSIGVINELIMQSIRDVRYRNQALAALESFFLHAASRNGYTIPEVAGLFPYRLDREAYERLVRESPWSFGMYSADRYIDGHISFTEPLGAGAGEALWLIRNALVAETRAANGEADGGVFLLSTIPSSWYEEGKRIELRDFPTHYGKLSVRVASRIESTGDITADYDFQPHGARKLESLVLRFAPPDHAPQDIRIVPQAVGTIRASFETQANRR